MKKFLVILLSALCILSLTACGGSKKDSEKGTTDKNSDNQQTSGKDQSDNQSEIKSPLDGAHIKTRKSFPLPVEK